MLCNEASFKKRLLRSLPILVMLLMMTGCGGPQRAAPVDVELARDTLKQVLQHWQDGGQLDDFRQQDPQIVVQELLWSNGNRLQEFRLTENARAENANWFCEVELTLAPQQDGGKPVTKTVTYAVGTDPVLTVFHAML